MDDSKKYPYLNTMLADAGRMYPEERLELVGLIGRVTRLEALTKGLVEAGLLSAEVAS